MAQKGVCELCGFADDSYRIEENDVVMKVCKFCHDGYLERMGLTPDADVPVKDVALTLDLEAVKEAGIDTEGLSGAELLQLEMELAARKTENSRVPSLNEKQLDTLLTATEDDKKVLTDVLQKEMRRKKKAAAKGEDETGEDYKASEELLRSGEELLRAMEGLQKIAEGDDDDEPDEQVAPLIAKIVAPKEETDWANTAVDQTTVRTDETVATEPHDAVKMPEKQSVSNDFVERDLRRNEDTVFEKKEQLPIKDSENNKKESVFATEGVVQDAKEMEMSDKKSKPMPKSDERVAKEQLAREKLHAEANQTIDDERIKITSPEVALSKDTRPKTNLDVAISEYAGGVRFLDAFKYVMHRVSYTVFLGLIVLAVATVMFIRSGWQNALIEFGGGVGAVGIGFLLMWYLSHCYELDRRAFLLRIRQQEILFESMNSDCYRELRTKFTIIKALGWLLNKMSVLLPLVTVIGGNIAAVIVAFTVSKLFWLFPIISVGASVAAVVLYYITKFCADCIAYKLDTERNQQIQQQTLLDILQQMKNK